MKIIDRIRKKLIEKEYEFTIPHFFEEMAEDDLEFDLVGLKDHLLNYCDEFTKTELVKHFFLVRE